MGAKSSRRRAAVGISVTMYIANQIGCPGVPLRCTSKPGCLLHRTGLALQFAFGVESQGVANAILQAPGPGRGNRVNRPTASPSNPARYLPPPDQRCMFRG